MQLLYSTCWLISGTDWYAARARHPPAAKSVGTFLNLFELEDGEIDERPYHLPDDVRSKATITTKKISHQMRSQRASIQPGGRI
jgi:hypothetical protein